MSLEKQSENIVGNEMKDLSDATWNGVAVGMI
jgi:hypothetical protein